MVACLNRYGCSVYLHVHRALGESANFRMLATKELDVVSPALPDVPHMIYRQVEPQGRGSACP